MCTWPGMLTWHNPGAQAGPRHSEAGTERAGPRSRNVAVAVRAARDGGAAGRDSAPVRAATPATGAAVGLH